MKTAYSRHWLTCSVAALLFATGPATTPAAAFNLFGLNLFGRDETEAEEIIGEPQTYTVTFTLAGVADGDLEERLQRASSLWQDRERPASGAAGLLAKARGDYRRLLTALYAQGRYGGSISIQVAGREAADLPPDAALPDPAPVTIAIDPGPVFLFGRTDIVNRAPPPVDPEDVVESPEKEGFRPGEVARSGVILEAERLAVEAWRQQGHAKAEAIERRVVAAHDRDIVDATLVLQPGRRAAYGPVAVQGTERMDPGFVAFMTGLQTGVEYDPDDLRRANERLQRLGVFRAARLEEAEAIGDDGLLPITVIVQERLPRRFGIGGSYSTVDGAALEAFWMHRNLFGQAERLRFDGRVARLGNTFDPGDLTYRVGASFVKPGVYTPDTDFSTSIFGDREVLEPYTRNAIRADAGFTQIFSEQLSARLLGFAEYAKFEDDVFGEREFVSAGFLGGVILDERDDKVDPTSGYYLEGVAQPFYEFNYGNAIASFTAEGRTYYGFGEERPIVLAGRLRLGTIVGAPISEIAPDKLFFAGGGGSVRGYAYRNIGVPVDGEITGGRALVEASAEVRARVTDTIGVVAFADAGYVGEDSLPDFSEDLRVGVGLGLRYYTGLGPIRLDLATPLDPRPSDPDVAFYVGIGQAF